LPSRSIPPRSLPCSIAASPVYDKDREGHYNLISALHKSMRGSDPQAALYYLARMLVAGEEPLYVLRRMVRFASEDIGLADPQALVQCLAAKDAYDFLGSPEGELAIVQACLYCATAPKSNAAYKAQKAAWKSARETGSLMPPTNILNAPTKLMKDIGYGAGYAYDHDQEEGFSGANYWPEEMPFVAVELASEGAGSSRQLAFRLNTGDLVVADADHPIALRGSADEPRPYLHVRAGLEALIARSVFYELAELAIEEQAAPGAALGLWSGGHFFPMSPA
jgi:hypothetical protein